MKITTKQLIFLSQAYIKNLLEIGRDLIIVIVIIIMIIIMIGRKRKAPEY